MKAPNRFPQTFLVFLLLPLLSFTGHKETSHYSLMHLSGEDVVLGSTANSENHETFFAAMKAANLDVLLDREGPFTVFAPSDNAFTKISTDKFNYLLQSEDKMQLKSLLRYHIIKGEVSASKILKALCRGGGRTTLTTIQGTNIRVSFKGNDIILTDNLGDSAKITIADLEQSNGIIHQIDRVIMPSRI